MTSPQPVPAHAGFAFAVNDDGSIGLFRAHDVDDQTVHQHVVDLPPVTTRYERGAGLVFVITAEWGAVHVPAAELARGDAWAPLGVIVPKASREAASAAVIAVARGLPLAKVSPKVTTGVPPLAPRLGPSTDDPEVGRLAWGAIADRLTPTGRLVIGTVLASPWIEVSGATAAVISLVGEGGGGKSLAARLGAAVFGPSSLGDGLIRSLNSAAQGLSSWAQEVAYYPLFLDEAQTATGDIEAQIRALVMGASRLRAGRSGSAVMNTARWGGLAVVTANEPLPLKHEMFDRRHVEIAVDSSQQLWQPRPSDIDAEAEWWAATARELTTLEGWAWQAMAEWYRVGTEDAHAFITYAAGATLPGKGNLGGIFRLGYAGASWLAHWTDNPTWKDGVWEAAVRLLTDRVSTVTDPARDAAQAVIAHRAMNPEAWENGQGREKVAYRSTYTDVCGIQHAGNSCSWVEILSEAFEKITPVSPKRLADTKFGDALYCTEKNRLTRKVKLPDLPRLRFYTACFSGLAEIADPDGDAVTLVPPILRQTSSPAPTAADPSVDAGATAPVYRFTDALTPMGVNWDDMLTGATDLIAPYAWTVAQMEMAGIDTDGWETPGSGRGRLVKLGSRSFRLHLHTDPEMWCEALADWATTTGVPVTSSPAALGTKLLLELARGGGRSKSPRWQLPSELDVTWGREGYEDGFAYPVGWGEKQPGDWQWDRNRSYLSAITQARIAPLWFGEEFVTYEADEVPVDFKGLAGMWLIEVPAWEDSRLPAPCGQIETGRSVWVSGEVMRLYQDRGVNPQVIRATLAPAHKVGALEAWSERVKSYLAATSGQPAEKIAKALYQSLAGSMNSRRRKGKQSTVYRPDWAVAIQQNSWCSVLRRVYRLADDHGWYPSRVNVDAIYYSKHDTPPDLPIGAGLGQFKFEGEVETVGRVAAAEEETPGADTNRVVTGSGWWEDV